MAVTDLQKPFPSSEAKTLGERLKFLRLFARLNQTDMAEVMTVTLRAYQSYELYKAQPKVNRIDALLDHFRKNDKLPDVNANWLISGDGKPFLVAGVTYGFDEDEAGE